MKPITLRLSEDLLSDLDKEADEAGFSSRSEYIRRLLSQRDAITKLLVTDSMSRSSNEEDLSQDQYLTKYTSRFVMSQSIYPAELPSLREYRHDQGILSLSVADHR